MRKLEPLSPAFSRTGGTRAAPPMIGVIREIPRNLSAIGSRLYS
jgi:hypothetical protein